MASRASSKSKAATSAKRGAAKAVAAGKKAVKKATSAAPLKKLANKAKKLIKKASVAAKSKAAAAPPPAPPRYHTVTPFLNVKGAQEAIEFYKKAFGAEERVRMPAADGSIMHAELTIGDSTIMLADASRTPETRSSIHLTVADCDALFERAVSAGGREKMALQDMFWGDRYGQVEDPFGNVWAISTHKEDVPPEELARRAAALEASPPSPPPATAMVE